MAIKVGGTTVVDDSRGLTNIATVDATTAAAISAAGVGGGGEHDFVASGAIANGDVVSLNSDGTVSVVAADGNAAVIGNDSVFNNYSSYSISAAYDSTNNKLVVVYDDNNNSSYGTAVVGTVSGTSISFGTPVVFASQLVERSAITFDAANNKVIIFWRQPLASPQGVAVVGTVSGTSISFGSSATVVNSGIDKPVATYDSSNNKVVLAWNTTGAAVAVVGTVSGTSISFGSTGTWSSSYADEPDITFDSTNNAIVIVHRHQANSSYGTAVVGTVSGTSISFGTPVVFSTSYTENPTVSFNDSEGKIVLMYYAGSSGVVRVGSVSGTSISFGAGSSFTTNSTQSFMSLYDSVSQKSYISYRNTQQYISPLTITGTTVSLGTASQIRSSSITDAGGRGYVFDISSGKFIFSFLESVGKSFTYQPASTNAADYIGIAAEAISDTATGAVTIDGGVNEGQSSLTIGTTYYVADDGSLTTTNNGRKIGKAISASEIIVDSAMTGDEMNEYLGSLV